jgi:hypothetical protein
MKASRAGASGWSSGTTESFQEFLLAPVESWYRFVMATTEDELETLFAKVRALPKARQELAVEALSEITNEETYALSDDERATLESALERAKRREFASEADIDEVLNKPWS